MPEYTQRVLDSEPNRSAPARGGRATSPRRGERGKPNVRQIRLFTVLLAPVLFFTGIAGKFDPGKARAALLVFAAVMLASVAVLLVTAPVAKA